MVFGENAFLYLLYNPTFKSLCVDILSLARASTSMSVPAADYSQSSKGPTGPSLFQVLAGE